MKTLILPIDVHSYIFIEENVHEYVVKNFGMKIPTQVKIHFTDDLYQRMMKTPGVMKENRFNTVEYISSTRKDLERSFVELLDTEGNVIEVSKYDDFDTKFNTFSKESFSVRCQSIYDYCFEIDMLYVNSWSDFSFSTKRFSCADFNSENSKD